MNDIAEHVFTTFAGALSSRENWIKTCVERYGNPEIDALEQIKRKDFILSSYSSSYKLGRVAYQTVIWYKGNAVAMYMDKVGIRGFWSAAYDEIPEVLPDGFNAHLLNWELVYGPSPLSEENDAND
jgi:hypothetical protein